MGTRLVTIQTHADTSSQHMCMHVHVHTVEPATSTPYNKQLSSPLSALAIENILLERTATPRISRKLLLR